ncbi:MAG TPA: ATP-binding cassette domain-containing protein [Methanospirillum sp.]|uniref:ATP-binding cassette domain-containing protein n=1 Tax=Methanospirillum sp. TaxID=45200 RepID=UPI002CAE477E|nr:ATP-binding cassette domain-containing protein [Methanospirillum sp.]HWQ63520.1 ATP-binding cassette domain-containing protein [Methanospirillum sp.]
MNILETRAITYEYRGGITALHNVSVAVPRNGCVALLGSNGAGKSTLMKHFNGIITAKSGEVLVDGERVSKENLRVVRQKIGMVFQNPDDQIFAPTVWEDIAFGPTNLGLSPEAIQERVNQSLQLLEVEHLADRPPHHLSGGEKKRVAIAGILAMNPEILVLDEPTSGLDPLGIRELIGLLRRLVQTRQISLMFSTHHVDLVPDLARYVYVMHTGEVIGQGTVEEIFADVSLLSRARLDVPILTRLVTSLQSRGVPIKAGYRFEDVEQALYSLISEKPEMR